MCKMRKSKEIIGLKFGRLTIIKELEPQYLESGLKKRMVLCKCDCGNETVVNYYELSRNNKSTKSCGCLSKEIASKNITKYNKSNKRKIYDYKKEKKLDEEILKQRKIRRRILNIRKCMIRRCYNELDDSYKYYGAKGIIVCDEWLKNKDSFVKWSLDNGYGEKLSIDRIDRNKPYCPENCRWVTLKEQMNNTSRNILISNKDGEIKTLAEWCDYYNIKYNILYKRAKRKKWELIEDLL